MSHPTFSEILQGEVNHFKVSKSRFEDILTWAERTKEITSTELIRNLPLPDPYFDLLHIQGNAFITSLLLLMKVHIFFSYAIARVGLEANINMAVIESDFNKNLKIWQNYNYTTTNNSQKFKQIKRDYIRVFQDPRKKHDFSAFMEEHEYDIIFKRWDYLCKSGSHTGFLQTIFSVDYENTEEEFILKSGIFDVKPDDINYVGKCMVYVIDTFFIGAKISARILNRHKVSLTRSVNDIETLYDEWFEFKLKKAKEFGIKPPEDL